MTGATLRYVKHDFAEYLMSRLPTIYHEEDEKNNHSLRRFIEVLGSGYDLTLQESMQLLDLIDVDKCPLKYLPLLCEMLGFEYTEELPELFLRRLLKNIVQIYKRKGTKSLIKYIAREVTEFDAEIIELQERAFRTWSTNPHKEYEMPVLSKTFSTHDTDTTYTYGEKYRHKNFIVKLIAPYEHGYTNQKLEVAEKVIDKFLATHSKAFYIGSFYFDDQLKLNEETAEEILVSTIKDYNDYLYDLGSQSYSACDILQMKVDIEDKYFSKGYKGTFSHTNLNRLNSSMYLNTYMWEKLSFNVEGESTTIRGEYLKDTTEVTLQEVHYGSILEEGRPILSLNSKLSCLNNKATPIATIHKLIKAEDEYLGSKITTKYPLEKEEKSFADNLPSRCNIGMMLNSALYLNRYDTTINKLNLKEEGEYVTLTGDYDESTLYTLNLERDHYGDCLEEGVPVFETNSKLSPLNSLEDLIAKEHKVVKATDNYLGSKILMKYPLETETKRFTNNLLEDCRLNRKGISLNSTLALNRHTGFDIIRVNGVITEIR